MLDVLSKERTIEIPVSVFAKLKSCEVKLDMIAEAVKSDTSTYGLSTETDKVIRLIVGLQEEKQEEKKDDTV